jgi:hypothetical protein
MTKEEKVKSYPNKQPSYLFEYNSTFSSFVITTPSYSAIILQPHAKEAVSVGYQVIMVYLIIRPTNLWLHCDPTSSNNRSEILQAGIELI